MSTPLQELSWDQLKPADEGGAQALVDAAANKLAIKRAAVQDIRKQAAKQGYGIEMDWSQLTPVDQPTARDEAIQRNVPGLSLAKARKFSQSEAANSVTHLPPSLPTRAAPVDQIAAQYEAIKAAGDLPKLSPQDYATFTAPLKAAGWEVGADYIKPPAAQPGAYPLWERQIAGQLKQGELPQGQAWYERTFAGRTARSLFEPIGGMIETAGKAAGQMAMGKPVAAGEALRAMTLKPQLDQLNEGYRLWKENGGHDSAESIAHGLAGLIPFLGPVAASFGEKVGKGTGKISAGDIRGWEDLIAAVPDAAMLAAPLISKGFAAMDKGVPAEAAMSDVASQLKPLLEKRLKETIAPEGTPATGAKPKVVLERGATPPQGSVESRLDAFHESLSPQEQRIYTDAREADPSYKAALKQWYNDDISTEDLWKAELQFAAKYSKEVTNAEAIRGDQGQLRQGGQAAQGGQAPSGPDVYSQGQGRVAPQPSGEPARGQVARQAEIANAEIPVTQVLRPEPAAGAQEAPAAGQVAQAARPAEARQGERSLPTTLEAAGLTPGTDLTYDVAANPATVEAAQRNLATKGIAGAAEYVRSAESPTAEHTATGFAAIRAMQDAGDYAGASELASDLSAKLTTSGQAVQAVKTIAEFAPEKAVVTAQKVLDAVGKGRKLTSIQAERVTKAAQAITEGNGRVAAAEAKVDAVAAKLPTASPANWRAKLTAAEDAARQRLAERQAKMKAGTLKEFGSGGLSTEELLDYATIGAAKLARKGIDFATWSAEMASEFGDSIKPHLARIYRASFEQYKNAKADAYQAMKERAVQKGLPPMTAEELATAVKQRDLAIKARTAATRQLAAEYEALQPGQRVKRELVSAMNAPRSIKASLDLSAPLRQGAVFVTEPKIAAKAFGKQLGALKQTGYERAYHEIQRSPEFDNARTAGLEFTGSPLRGNDALSLREEAFMSRWAEKIPGVAASERAYVTYLDTLRINLFEKYAAEIRQAVKDPKAVDAELKSVASFINKATGRGDLGRYGNAAAPVLNSVFFAPRYAISRLQILNPATYAKMTPMARGIALRKMFQFTGLVGTTLALAKASGLEVGTDVESPDFLKIKVGDTRFDLLAGEQQYMRAAARLAKGFYANATGAKLKDSEQPASIAGRFARSKLAPIPGAIADLATGKTFEGQPVVPQAEKGKPPPTTGEKVSAVAKREGSELFTPLFIKDAYDAWKTQTTGVPTKIAATAGGLLGVGVQTYANKRAEPAEFKKLSMEDAAKAYREARPEQRLQLRRQLIQKRDAALQHAKTLADRRRIYDEYRQAIQ